jgi:hypothetical protein
MMICSGVLHCPWLIRSSKIEVRGKPNSLINDGPLFQGQASQFPNEPLGILPTDLLYGSVITPEMTGVVSHDMTAFGLRHLELAHRGAVFDPYIVDRLLVVISFTQQIAHAKLPWRDRDHFGAVIAVLEGITEPQGIVCEDGVLKGDDVFFPKFAR